MEIIPFYAAYVFLALYVSRYVELHYRILFHRCWVLARKRHEAEDALIKSKFTDEQLQIIRQVMECRNDEIDDELQEVLIESEDIQMEELLGKGAYGEVFKAKYEGIYVAVKVIRDINEAQLERTRAEILLMKGLQHDCIVMFIGACWDEYLMGIVLELVENGPLANFLHNERLHLSWQHPKLSMAKDAANGCNYLHQSTYYSEREDNWHECIIHRDLKPDNMLVTTTYGVKLTDFGEARSLDSEATMTQVGSPVYMAPEMLRGERYDERIDIYSYAITLTEMLVLADNIFDVFNEKYKKLHDGNNLTPLNLTKAVAIQNFRPDIPNFVFPSLKSLITDCWNNDPNRRPSFEEIIVRLDADVHREVFASQLQEGSDPQVAATHRRKMGKQYSTHLFEEQRSAGRRKHSQSSSIDAQDERVNSTKDETAPPTGTVTAARKDSLGRRGEHLKKMMSKRLDVIQSPVNNRVLAKRAASSRDFARASTITDSAKDNKGRRQR